MITWGISANSHHAAISVHFNDSIQFASHCERFSGIKNDANLNQDIISYSLQWGYHDKIVWYMPALVKSKVLSLPGIKELDPTLL